MKNLKTGLFMTQQYQPLAWCRYIDEIFFSCIQGQNRLKEFLKEPNAYHPSLKFTHEFDREESPILNLLVGVSNGTLGTDLYVKRTDCHQYFGYTSSRPELSKKSIVSSIVIEEGRTLFLFSFKCILKKQTATKSN